MLLNWATWPLWDIHTRAPIELYTEGLGLTTQVPRTEEVAMGRRAGLAFSQRSMETTTYITTGSREGDGAETAGEAQRKAENMQHWRESGSQGVLVSSTFEWAVGNLLMCQKCEQYTLCLHPFGQIYKHSVESIVWEGHQKQTCVNMCQMSDPLFLYVHSLLLHLCVSCGYWFRPDSKCCGPKGRVPKISTFTELKSITYYVSAILLNLVTAATNLLSAHEL